MNKEQFTNDLRSRLKSLSDADAARSIDYYSEMIEDCIEGGMSEEEAVKSMGAVEEIAGQILAESDETLEKTVKIKPARKLRTWEIILLAVGSPVWLPILLGLLIILVSAYVVIWSLVCVMYAVLLSFAAGTLVGIAGGIANLFIPNYVQSLLFFGSGVFLAGLAPLWLLLSNYAAKATVELGKLAVRLCLLPFARKEKKG